MRLPKPPARLDNSREEETGDVGSHLATPELVNYIVDRPTAEPCRRRLPGPVDAALSIINIPKHYDVRCAYFTKHLTSLTLGQANGG